MINITTATPVEIDTELARIYGETLRAEATRDRAETNVRYAAGARRTWDGWSLSLADALAKVEQTADATPTTYVEMQARETLKAYALAVHNLRTVAAQADPFTAEFNRRGGWTRSFIVTNADGHAHRSMDCSTCNRGRSATQFVWMIEWSAKPEADIVAAAGWRACTVCYPSAPVGDEHSLPTAMHTPDDTAKAAAREARDAAKIAREAKRLAAAATVTGDDLLIYVGNRYPERFKTERAATIWATDHLAYVAWGYYARDDQAAELAKRTEAVRIVAEAIAAKRGVSADVVAAEIAAKGAKKAKQR